MLKKISKFIRETKIEVSKVSWPTRGELFDSALAVIFSVAMMVVFIGAVDFILSRLLNILLSK